MAKAKYSPCVKVCTYDKESGLFCLGCQRTSEEVAGWRDRTEEEQLAGIEMLRDRRIYRTGHQNDIRREPQYAYPILSYVFVCILQR